jgi:hypothetical protein
MRRIAQLIGYELKWEQPSLLKMEYNLNTGDDLVGTLRFRSSFGTLATGESGDGCWTFKRVGFFRTKVTIRDCGSDLDIAAFKDNTWSGGGTLELPDGRKFLATTNFWQTQFDIKADTGEPLIHFGSGGLMRLSAVVTMEPQAASVPELPWMVMLGWYLMVMMHMESASAVVVTTTVV